MKMTRSRAILCILSIGSLFSLLSVAEEKKISRSELPAQVEKTVTEQSQNATIHGFSKEKEKGKTYYEAEMMVNGHHKDVLIDTNGTIVEVEEEVPMDSLPTAVRSGLQAKAAEGKLQKVESLTKHGKLIAYEAKVLNHGKRSEIQVGPEGRPLE
jgi:uncharacterized protein YxeA